MMTIGNGYEVCEITNDNEEKLSELNHKLSHEGGWYVAEMFSNVVPDDKHLACRVVITYILAKQIVKEENKIRIPVFRCR